MLDATAPGPDEGRPDAGMRERLDAVVSSKQREAENRVYLRSGQEKIWLDDLRAYYGNYDSDTWARLTKDRPEKSKLHMAKSGTKTRAWVSRLQDILFPTDDKNWSIGPTPVPAFSRDLQEATENALELEKQAAAEAEAAAQAAAAQQQDPNAPAAEAAPEPTATPETMDALAEAQERRRALQAAQKEARGRSDLMSEEMDDQLLESNYAQESRDGIEQGCQMGTAIWEGPIVESAKRRWKQVPERTEVDPETGEETLIPASYQREEGGAPRPKYARVDIWNFFPSPGATCVADSDGFYIRYPWNDSQLRAFAKYPGVDVDRVREILKDGRKGTAPDYMQRLAEIAPDQSSYTAGVHTVWKYVGPVAAEDMMTIAVATGDAETAMELHKADPLDEIQAIIWFCDGRLLKLDIFPLDTDEPYFTRWVFEKGPGFWGLSVPYLLRNPNAAVNAGWRLMMDNSEVSSLPQLFIDGNRCRPVDDSYVIRGGKIWTTSRDAAPEGMTGKEMYAVNIDSHQGEIANIIALASAEMDELSMLPPQAMGGEGGSPTETAQGMALWMNANNVLLKRVVKNWDDDKTVPEIRKLYDWNMQYSEREEIKGDYQVDARGSSVLLVREMQARNIVSLALNFGGHPEYGPMTKKAELYREVYRVHQLPADRYVKTDEELDAEAANVAPDPMLELETRKLDIEENKIDAMDADSQARLEAATMENDTKLKVAKMNYDAVMQQAENRFNSDRERDDQKSEIEERKIAAKERSVAVETALKSRPEAPINEIRIDN